MKSVTPELLVSLLKSHLPDHLKTISLHEPLFIGNEWNYVKACLDTGWVSSVGSFVDRFEKELADFTGANYAIVTVNGTAALHVALMLAGVKAGDEVLVPTLTFVASCNAIAYCQAIPHFVDSDYRSLGVDPIKLALYLKEVAEVKEEVCWNKKTGRRISALCVMHTFGHPVDLDPLVDLCERYKIKLVEDAAEALGSYYKGEHVGHRGLIGTLSFNGNKIITTGGGGAIITNDEVIAKRAKHITTTAKLSHAWAFNHDEIAYNYRLPNINSALGCAQLEHIEDYLSFKRKLANAYQLWFNDQEGLTFFLEPDYAKSNYWLNVVILEASRQKERDVFLKVAHQAGLMLRPVWTLMHKLPFYSDSPKMDLSVAEDLEARIINLPSSVFLGKSL